MAATIHVPSALRRFTDDQAAHDVAGATVGEALADLVGRYPALKKHLYTDDGTLRSFVNVYVNDEDVRYKERDATPVGERDEIFIIPSIAGGSTVAEEVELSAEEIQRYSRHLLLSEVGVAGQKKLKAAKVLLIGAGGLGSPLALYLAAAGVGRIGIVDFDVVDETNLQRQLLHGTKDVGRPKLDSARDRIRDVNPNVEVVGYNDALSSANALEILRDYDVVADGTDNFPTRYLVNDACVLLGKPNAYGSIFRFEGQASVFDAQRGPCYRCLYPEPPPPGLVPSCAGGRRPRRPARDRRLDPGDRDDQAHRWGSGSPLAVAPSVRCAWNDVSARCSIRKDPDCAVCGANPTVTELIDYEQFCGIKPAPSADDVAEVEALRGKDWEITPVDLKIALDTGRPVYLLDVREPHEVDICQIPGMSKLIPVGSLGERLSEIETADPIVVYCRSGVRSARAFDQLRAAGFGAVRNLKGGILAWSRDVDPSVPQY